MNIHRIIAKVYCEPWSITPQGFGVIHGTIKRHLTAGMFDLEDHSTKFDGDPVPVMQVDGNTAIIPVKGPLFQHATIIEKKCGACSYEDIRRDLNAAMGNTAVERIWLDIDSPGGQCVGNQECAGEIERIRKEGYDIFAWTGGEMCSAAYNIAAACNAIVSTRSAWVGCIGAMMALLDDSKAFEMEGLKTELFKSGPLKGVGTEGLAINDEQRAYLQGLVDKFAAMFKSNVTANRRGVKEEVMQGQCIIGEDAVAAGLVDEICTSLEDAIERVS